jgi:hypothetical protein
MRTIIQGLILSGLVLILSGCGTPAPKIYSQANTTIDFSEYRSFAMLPFTAESMQGSTSPGLLLQVGQPVTLEIQSNMQRLGYIPVGDVEKADIAINIVGNSVPKVEVTDYGYGGYYGAAGYPYGAGGWAYGYPYAGRYGGYGMGVGMGGGVRVDQYDEGTLGIEAYDTGTKELIWVGWATGRVSKDGPDLDRLRATIQQVLARFPVSSHAGPGNAVPQTPPQTAPN